MLLALKPAKWKLGLRPSSTLFMQTDLQLDTAVSEVRKCFKTKDVWALFIYIGYKKKLIQWECPILKCRESGASYFGRTKSILSLKLRVLRHFQVAHSNGMPKEMEILLQSEWSFIKREFGASVVDLFQEIPKRLKHLEEFRSSSHFVIYLHDSGLSDLFGSKIVCEICCGAMKDLMHMQKHTYLKSKMGFSEFFLCNESAINEHTWPHPLLAYESYDMEHSTSSTTRNMYKWHCRIPSCPKCEPLTFPTVVLLKMYALRHFEVNHEGLFNLYLLENEWAVLCAEADINNFDLRRHKQKVEDVEYPSDFILPVSNRLIPFEHFGERICGFCFFTSSDDNLLKSHLSEHGYDDKQKEPFLPAKSLESGHVPPEIQLDILKDLHPSPRLYGNKKMFKELQERWEEEEKNKEKMKEVVLKQDEESDVNQYKGESVKPCVTDDHLTEVPRICNLEAQCVEAKPFVPLRSPHRSPNSTLSSEMETDQPQPTISGMDNGGKEPSIDGTISEQDNVSSLPPIVEDAEMTALQKVEETDSSSLDTKSLPNLFSSLFSNESAAHLSKPKNLLECVQKVHLEKETPTLVVETPSAMEQQLQKEWEVSQVEVKRLEDLVAHSLRELAQLQRKSVRIKRKLEAERRKRKQKEKSLDFLSMIAQMEINSSGPSLMNVKGDIQGSSRQTDNVTPGGVDTQTPITVPPMFMMVKEDEDTPSPDHIEEEETQTPTTVPSTVPLGVDKIMSVLVKESTDDVVSTATYIGVEETQTPATVPSTVSQSVEENLFMMVKEDGDTPSPHHIEEEETQVTTTVPSTVSQSVEENLFMMIKEDEDTLTPDNVEEEETHTTVTVLSSSTVFPSMEDNMSVLVKDCDEAATSSSDNIEDMGTQTPAPIPVTLPPEDNVVVMVKEGADEPASSLEHMQETGRLPPIGDVVAVTVNVGVWMGEETNEDAILSSLFNTEVKNEELDLPVANEQPPVDEVVTVRQDVDVSMSGEVDANALVASLFDSDVKVKVEESEEDEQISSDSSTVGIGNISMYSDSDVSGSVNGDEDALSTIIGYQLDVEKFEVDEQEPSDDIATTCMLPQMDIFDAVHGSADVSAPSLLDILQKDYFEDEAPQLPDDIAMTGVLPQIDVFDTMSGILDKLSNVVVDKNDEENEAPEPSADIVTPNVLRQFDVVDSVDSALDESTSFPLSNIVGDLEKDDVETEAPELTEVIRSTVQDDGRGSVDEIVDKCSIATAVIKKDEFDSQESAVVDNAPGAMSTVSIRKRSFAVKKEEDFDIMSPFPEDTDMKGDFDYEPRRKSRRFTARKQSFVYSLNTNLPYTINSNGLVTLQFHECDKEIVKTSGRPVRGRFPSVCGLFGHIDAWDGKDSVEYGDLDEEIRSNFPEFPQGTTLKRMKIGELKSDMIGSLLVSIEGMCSNTMKGGYLLGEIGHENIVIYRFQKNTVQWKDRVTVAIKTDGGECAHYCYLLRCSE